jgi:hypothetical protein
VKLPYASQLSSLFVILKGLLWGRDQTSTWEKNNFLGEKKSYFRMKKKTSQFPKGLLFLINEHRQSYWENKKTGG